MNIKITADSTCDLPKDLIEKYDIGIVPLYIVKGDSSLKDGIEINPQDIFDYVESGTGICHTAAVNVLDYLERFSAYLKDYDAVIHINISSDFSACNQNANIAASELQNVYVVDSRNLSSGSGHLVLDASHMASAGMAPGEIVERLKEQAKLVEASFVIDTLKYLYKGGRCSGIAALGANVLKLKPCIEVVDGKMEVGKKYRGNMDKIILQYISDRINGRDDIDARRIFITHTSVSDAILSQVRDELKNKFEEIIESDAGCTISNHCGPGTLGILFYRK